MSVQNLDLHDYGLSSDFVNDIDSLLNSHDPDFIAPFFAPFRTMSPPYSFPEHTHLALPTSSHRPPFDPQDALNSLVLTNSVYPDTLPVLDLHSSWSMATQSLAPEISIQPEKLSMGTFNESAKDPLFLDHGPLNEPLGVPVPLDPSHDPCPLEPTIDSALIEPFPYHSPFEHHTFVNTPPPQSHYPPPHYHGDWADYRHESRETVPVSQVDRHHGLAPWTLYPTGSSMSVTPPPHHHDHMSWDMYERPERPWSPLDPSHHRGRSIQSHEASPSPSPRFTASDPISFSKRRSCSDSTHPSGATITTRSKRQSVSIAQPSGTHRKQVKKASPRKDKYCNFTRWMAVEIELLISLVRQQKDKDNIQWDQIAEDMDTERSPSQCQNRWNAEMAKNDPSKAGDDTYVLKGRWSPDEDRALKQGVVEFLRKQGLMPKPPAYLPDEEEERYPIESRVPITRKQDDTSDSELFNSLVDNQLCDDTGPDVSAAYQACSKVNYHQQFSNQSSASSLSSPYHSSPSSPSSFSTTSSTPPHRSHRMREVSGSSASTTAIRTRQDYENQVSRMMQKCPWNLIVLQSIPGRTGIQAQARWSEALDPQVRRGKWTEREDRMLFEGAETHTRCWIRIADGIPGRTQRQCRTRWVQLRTKREREEAEAKALELAAKQQEEDDGKKKKEKRKVDDNEGEEEETRGMKKVIHRKGRNIVLGRQFA